MAVEISIGQLLPLTGIQMQTAFLDGGLVLKGGERRKGESTFSSGQSSA